MFRQTTESDRARHNMVRRIAAIAAACLVALAIICCNIAGQTTKEQGAEALRVSIVKAAQQCCAVEGSYPDSLEHLEQSYGLSINRNDYVVTYEVFAANVMPTVAVVPK